MRRATILTLVAALLLAVTAGAAVAKDIRGTNGPDNITGTSKADDIKARGGNDEVRGLKGSDTIHGGSGSDLLRGGDGNDKFFGTPGNDTIDGDKGEDRIEGGIGRDVLEGRSGNDRIIAAGDGQRDQVNCGLGGDDVTIVDLNDVVDGKLVSSVLEVGTLVGTIGSCETVKVRILS